MNIIWKSHSQYMLTGGQKILLHYAGQGANPLPRGLVGTNPGSTPETHEMEHGHIQSKSLHASPLFYYELFTKTSK